MHIMSSFYRKNKSPNLCVRGMEEAGSYRKGVKLNQNTEQEMGLKLGRKLIAGNGEHLDYADKTIVTCAHRIIENELRMGQ